MREDMAATIKAIDADTIQLDFSGDAGPLRVTFGTFKIYVNPLWESPKALSRPDGASQLSGLDGHDLQASSVPLLTAPHNMYNRFYDPGIRRQAREEAARRWFIDAYGYTFRLRTDPAVTPFGVRTDIAVAGGSIPVWWYEDGTLVVVEQGSWDEDGPLAGTSYFQAIKHDENISPHRYPEQQDILTSGLTNLFRQKYNALLLHPLLLDGIPPLRQELTFARGDAQRLMLALSDAIALQDGAENYPASLMTVGVWSGTPISKASVNWGKKNKQYLSSVHPAVLGSTTRTDRLCDRIVEAANPVGWTIKQSLDDKKSRHTNRGWHYSEIYLALKVPVPTAAGRMEALDRLEEALDFYGISQEERQALLPE